MPRRRVPHCKLCGTRQGRLFLTGCGAHVCDEHARELAGAVLALDAASLPSPAAARQHSEALGDCVDRMPLRLGGLLSALADAEGGRIAVEFDAASGRMHVAAL